jgi:hypothetical protein
VTATIDLSQLNYEEWLTFVFDHPVHEPLWYFSDAWNYEVSDPEKALAYVIRLFTNPAILLRRFSLPHIEQGFWFLPSVNGLMWLILLPSIPWQARLSAVHSIKTLFETFFSQVELGTSIYMWWDSLITYCTWEDKDLLTDRELLREIITVMGQLLSNPAPRVRESIRHGVEHLKAIAMKEGDADLTTMLRSAGLLASPS